MAIPRDRVVLCRGLSERNDSQDSYVRLLEDAGYSCTSLKTLCFKFVNTAELKECLLASETYYGVILTSRRAVEAIEIASNEDRDILQAWTSLPAYCVGPSTETLARNILKFNKCLGSESGNATELAKKIINDLQNEAKPLLYPCSDIARETIEQTLISKRINLHKLTAYCTLASETLGKDVLNLIDKPPRIFVFFSPSTVAYITAVLKEHCYDIRNMKAVAIGPVTAQALIDAGFNIFAVAEKPEPTALLNAIKAAKLKNLRGAI